MIDSCQVRKCTKVCRYVGTAAPRLHGDTVAHKIARWCHGAAPVGAPGGTVVLCCHGGALGLTATRLRHMCGKWHNIIVCQVKSCDRGLMARSLDYVSARRDAGKVAR